MVKAHALPHKLLPRREPVLNPVLAVLGHVAQGVRDKDVHARDAPRGLVVGRHALHVGREADPQQVVLLAEAQLVPAGGVAVPPQVADRVEAAALAVVVAQGGLVRVRLGLAHQADKVEEVDHALVPQELPHAPLDVRWQVPAAAVGDLVALGLESLADLELCCGDGRQWTESPMTLRGVGGGGWDHVIDVPQPCHRKSNRQLHMVLWVGVFSWLICMSRIPLRDW